METIIHPVMPPAKTPLAAEVATPTWEYLKNGLVKHVPTGNFYSRYQVHGKRTMKKLGTNNAGVAKLRHLDLMAKNERTRQSGARIESGKGTMGDIIREGSTAYESNSQLSQKSKICFKSNLVRLEKHWELCFSVPFASVLPGKITGAQVERFANYLSTEAEWRRHNTRKVRHGYGPATANVTLEILLRLMTFAKARNYISEIPFQLKGDLGKASLLKPEPRKKIEFPTQQKIQAVFDALRSVGNVPNAQPELLEYLQRRADESGDLAEFMAYSGARIKEAAVWAWEDERDSSVFIRGTKSQASQDREVPKIPAMVELLRRMKARRTAAAGRELTGKAFNIRQCAEGLTTACKRAGVPRWTHHTLRHLFATKCIESKVDVSTVSRWLGHADGGALCMRTYGHLRQEHSQAQAMRVNFGGNSQ